jgi:putative FmdB family regulatory protein
MPMYEYGCLACHNRFDRLRRMDQNDSDLSCPHCRSAQVQRKLSTFAAHSRGARSAPVAAAPAPRAGGCCGGSCGCGSRN